ncbi:MAG: pantoate--beta-alanine ligase [Fibrobacter sp.]|nr:pantoate--beta-alanine ligase [Fibrobacter sp.]
MKIVKSVMEMKNLCLTYQRSGKTIGLVPTMGALHRGHLSLLERAGSQTDITAMSLFVNPTQFGPQEDFQKYPRLFEQDCSKAQGAGCDILFAPTVKEMYPEPYFTFVSVERITETLCGAKRPGHFRGVATVVLKLFNIVNPQVAVFGQKDAQQVAVIKRMVHDLNLSIKIDVAPIVREDDGLAMSSRNAYLTQSERSEVHLISAGLKKAEALYSSGERDAGAIKDAVRKEYSRAGFFNPEYIEVADTVFLKPAEKISVPVILAVACVTRESKTRLIDNIVLGGSL